MRRICLLAVVLLALMLVACGKRATDEDALAVGRAHLEAGEYAEAVSDLEAAVAADPSNGEAHFALGQAYFQTGDLEKAMAEFRTVLATDPDNAAAHHNLGVVYFQMRDPNAAVAEFQAALELDAGNPDTHYQLGATYLALAFSSLDPNAPPDPQMLEQATAEFQAALDLEVNMPQALIGMGNVYIAQADYAAAIETLEKAIAQVPDSPEAYFALGGAYAQSGNTVQACTAYRRFMELNPPPDWQEQGQQAMAVLGCP
jgi:tetratricopeptide (TPR) repeat protein